MKNQELNLVKLLKDCPKGTKFYSPIFGEVEFQCVTENKFPIIVEGKHSIQEMFMSDGRYINLSNAECLLFPSKDQRDWNIWKQEQDKKKVCPLKVGDHVIDNRDNTLNIITRVIDKDNVEARFIDGIISIHLTTDNLTKIYKYPISRFLPFDRVLVRDTDTGTWMPDFYGSKCDEYYGCVGGVSTQCVPYNEETKHLLGTTEKAPEFYINW